MPSAEPASPSLDFRFAWRWLLPPADGVRVALAGFSAEENAFWAEEHPTSWTGDHLDDPSHWIVDGDRARPNGLPPGALAHAETASVVGSAGAMREWKRALRCNFTAVREYALLPPGAPRVAMPLGSGRRVSAALQLHRPGRRRARVVMALARAFAMLGVRRAFSRMTICVGVRDPATPPRGARAAGLMSSDVAPASCAALYMGAARAGRMTVVLPLASVPPRRIVKIAAGPSSMTPLRNEIDALGALRHSCVADRVPRLLGVNAEDDVLALHQEYRPRRAVAPRRYRREVVRFLADLSSENREERSLSSLLDELVDDPRPSFTSSLRARMSHEAERGVQVWGHRCHGDFAPWNCTWTGTRGVFAFDWERSRRWGVAFSDAFYFIVGQAIHVGRGASPRTVRRDALRLAHEVAVSGEVPATDLALYWRIWLLQRAGERESAEAYARLARAEDAL